MKLVVSALCLCLLVGAATAETKKKCRSNEDCGEDECCVNYFLVPFFGGTCNDLRNEGESCTPIDKLKQEEPPKMYHYICPCKEGFKCEATHEIEIFGHIVKHRPECIKPGDEVTTGNEIGEPDAN